MGKENGKIREKKRVKREKGGGKDKGVQEKTGGEERKGQGNGTKEQKTEGKKSYG